MRRCVLTHPAREAGFGIVELIVALVISTVMLIAIFSAFLRTMGTSHRVTNAVESRQHARLALQLLERDIRMAGSGWGRARVDGSWNGAAVVYYGLIPGPGGTGASDSLQVLGAWSAVTSLRDPMPTTSTTIRCATVAGFSVGDLCVVTNGASAHLFQVTGVTSSPADLAHDSASPYNQTGGFLNWPPGGYGAGAQVMRADMVSYRYDPSSFSHPCLVRQESGRAPQMAAWNVDHFTVSYLLENGTVTREPDTVTVIARVIPTIVARSSPTLLDSVQAEIRPRAF